MSFLISRKTLSLGLVATISSHILFSFLYWVTDFSIETASAQVAFKKSVNAEKASQKKVEKLDYVPGEVIVKFKPSRINLKTGKGKEGIRSLEVDEKVKVKKAFQNANASLLGVEENEKVEDAVNRIKKRIDVEFAQPNYIYRTSSVSSNDTAFSKLWWLSNSGQTVNGTSGVADADMDVTEAWDIFTGSLVSPNGLVAVIDDGVAYMHPELVNKMWNGDSCLTQSGAPLGGCRYGYDFYNGDKDPLPEYGDDHGTHVAGTIAAESDNANGIAGVNPGSRIMALKAWEDGGLSTSAILDSIAFAKFNGAKVINASWGINGVSTVYPYSSNVDYVLYNAIKDFADAGGLFIAAAGNDSTNHDSGSNNDRFFPSDFSRNITLTGGLTLTGLTNIISVASTNQSDGLSSFSDYGANSVHIGAPGSNIYSTSIVTDYAFVEDFSYSTGAQDLGYFTNVENTWRTIHDGFSLVSMSDPGHYPYQGSSNSTLATTFAVTGSLLSSARLGFGVWCDTPATAAGVYKDYLLAKISSGSTWTVAGAYDESSISRGGGFPVTVDGHLGSYNYYEFNIPKKYLVSELSLNFQWITDAINDEESSGVYHKGCSVDDVYLETYSNGSGNNYVYKNGTSMATPHVSGLASLIWSYKPTLTASEVKNIIFNTGDSLWALSGKTITGKRANAYKALASLASPTISNLKMYSSTWGVEITSSGYTNSMTPYFTWDVPTKAGTMSGYLVDISNSSGSIFSKVSTGAFATGSLLDDGTYTVSVTAQNDMGANGSATSKQFTLDTIKPKIEIVSHTDGQYVTWATIALVGETVDVGGLQNVVINDELATGTHAWSHPLFLYAWANLIRYESTDLAGNTSTGKLIINRVSEVLDVGVSIESANSLKINFTTNFTGTGYVMYGTDPNNLSYIAETNSGTEHVVAIPDLIPDSTYYFKTFSVFQSLTWFLSPLYSVSLPQAIDSASLSGTLSATGSVAFSGVTATGLVLGENSGALDIKSNDIPHSVEIPTNNLTIITATGSWNGILQAPTPVIFTGAVTDTGYTLTGSVYQIGSPTAELVLSGQTANVKLYVGDALNGKTYRVMRSSDGGVTFNNIGSCVVSSWYCSFATSQFSLFALTEPSDSIPDAFSFTAANGVELTTTTTSNTVSITGINTPSTISISGGSYSINNGSFTSNSGTISAGDTVKVNVVSSSSYSTSVNATVTIGGVSGTFSATTKSAPSSGGGGGGGGGWGGGGYVQPIDSCPNGDTSGNMYDGKCSIVTVSTGTTVSSGATVTSPTVISATSSTIISTKTLDKIISNKVFNGVSANRPLTPKMNIALQKNFIIPLVQAIKKKKLGIKEVSYYDVLIAGFNREIIKRTNPRDKKVLQAIKNFLILEKKKATKKK